MGRTDCIVGLDLGGTKLAAAAFRADGDSVQFLRALPPMSYEQILGTADATKLTAEVRSHLIEQRMSEAVRELCAFEGHELGGVGVATAGFVEKGMIVEGHNTGMKNYPLRSALETDLGVEVFLYKDAWAPVYALGPGRPSMIFSIGTGFGGVSAEADMTIKLRSYSASQKLIWIPFLYCNDDPGYAVSFSSDDMASLIRIAQSDFDRKYPGSVSLSQSTIEELIYSIKRAARGEEKVSPGRFTLLLAKSLAFKAAVRMHPKEVYADFICASQFPSFLQEKLTGRLVAPKDLDILAASGDLDATFAFRVQAEFIGYVLFKMQQERHTYGLQPAERVLGTGSGYNEITRKLMGETIVASMCKYAASAGMQMPPIGPAEILQYPDGDTTLACYGAAVGAANAIRV